MSNYNPYAAPAADAVQGANLPVRGEPQPWNVGDAIRSGWELYKAHWAPLTFGYFIITLIGALPGQVAPMLAIAGTLDEGSHTYYAVHVPLSFFGWILAEYFAAGFTRTALRAVRANEASFGDFFGAGSQFLPFIAMSFLRSLAVGVGIVLLVVPGVIAGLGFANAPYFVIDQRLGPIAALKASWDVSDGQKGTLLVLSFAEIGLIFAGVAACCLGLFVAVPVMMLARAVVYTKMSGTAPPPAAPPGPYAPAGPPGPPMPAGPYQPGYGGPWGPPGGGYGQQ